MVFGAGGRYSAITLGIGPGPFLGMNPTLSISDRKDQAALMTGLKPNLRW
jgi:hypothetical protein